MKLVDKLKDKMVSEIFTNEEIDIIMEQEKYFSDERDEENEEGILKYTNNRSQIWIKYIRDGVNYLVSDVTMRTKKSGKTKVRAFRSFEEIKLMMDYFRKNERYDDFLTFMLGLFLARRVGDTLSLKWSDFYFENGRKKENLDTLIEDKTDKIIKMSIAEAAWKYIEWYCEIVGIDPMEHLHDDIFNSKHKQNLSDNYSEAEYKNAIEKQESAYRYQFQKAAAYNGIEGVSTHSTRKSFGRIAHEINKFDPDCLPVLQTIYGHVNVETTKIYIDIMDEKAKKMFDDVAQCILDIDNGIKPVIDNVPVIALKTNDLRDILSFAYKKGIENKELNASGHIETINQLLSMLEEVRVS